MKHPCKECNEPTNNPKFCSLSCSTVNRNKKINTRKIKEYDLNPKRCLECNGPIRFDTRKSNIFCLKSCFIKYEHRRRKNNGWQHPSNLHRSREEEREVNRARSIGAEGPFCFVSFTICKVTSKIYRNNIPNSKRGGHIQRSPYVNLDKKTQYYEDAQFKFYIYDYPDEFDLALVEKYGWYSTPGSRKGVKNINGVSRDHMFSISEAFKLGVDPKIISHPANCHLLRHRANKAKNGSCSISLDELYERIERWNQNYD